MLFTDPLLSVLPPQVHAKVRRLDADPVNAGLMAAAALHLDMTGATFRFNAHGEVLRHVKTAVPPHVQDHAAGVAEVRRQLDELAAEWRATEYAPSKADDLRRGFTDAVDRIAQEAAPVILQTQRGGLSPVQLDSVLALNIQDIGRGRIHGNAAPFFVWLLRDEIAQRIGELIDAIPQDGALSDDERDERFGSIGERRLSLERIEEAIIVAAEAEGIMIPRRPDADPRAVMEIDIA